MTRIIVADDDRITSHLVCSLLRKQGYQPEAAFDVPSFLLLSRRSPVPDVVLLDLHMPGGTGVESVRWFMEDPTLARIPLVLMSGTNGSAAEALGFQLGAMAFLGKPIDPVRLQSVVSTALLRPAAGLE